ncbi:hypothetical protein ElyMa_004277600 [Elysia marginata]|uniref:Uncharacterized protein n=1 Tax=Elysia marginata TaxID=1093978 RepID=A0AAV4GU75_9GAST|nr:hypothetical protein ElyMa_004277600 [Elysia marginata]
MTNAAYDDPTPTDTILTAQSWFQNFNNFLRTDTRLTYRLTATVGINVDSGSWTKLEAVPRPVHKAFLEHNSLKLTVPKTNNEQDKTMTPSKIFI